MSAHKFSDNPEFLGLALCSQNLTYGLVQPTRQGNINED